MNSILLSLSSGSRAVSNGIEFFKPLYWLFGQCMRLLMELLGNQYFVALVIFTIVTRLLLLPLNIKQQKNHGEDNKTSAQNQKNSEQIS